ncbi:MAG: hypothetical protein IIC21_11040, partial [Chloroflexi bacterium]|nr:hypothetical protein [Chloroflexota bacterium]
MSLSILSGALQAAPQYKQLQRDLERPRVGATAQVLDSAVPFTLATLHRDLSYPILVLTPRPEDARRLHEQLLVWSDDEDHVLHFPESEILPFERLSSDSDTVHQRLRTLSRLIADDGPAPIVVASVAAVTQKTIDRKSFVATSHTLARGQQIDLDELMGQWLKMGYQFESSVYGPGFVSRRGGIVDIFPMGAEMPARIELWGNEIDSIRLFDPSTQRSTEVVESINVTVTQEPLPALTSNEDLDRSMAHLDVSNCTQTTQERLREEFDLLAGGHEVEDLNFYAGFFCRGSLLDFMQDDSLVIRYRPPDIAEAAGDIEQRTNDLREAKEGRGELPRNFPSSHLLWNEVEEGLARIHRRLDVTPWGA